MFRHLPVFEHEDPVPKLTALAERMIAGAGPPPDNPDIPSGYTYLGQFIDHDITFDPVSSLGRQNDPDALHNFRTPRYDLDSVYGRGPADQPYLYEKTGHITRMKLGEDVGVVPGQTSGAGPDLPRNEPRQRDGQDVFFGRALIGDPRNDENLLVSQLHLTMLQFHNKVIEHVAATTPLEHDNLFKEAQRLVRWHYQWVVVNDFVRRVAGDAVVDDILRTETMVVGGGGQQISLVRPRFQFYNPSYDAFIPVEFAVAAYRFGHSMIRGRYHINTFVRDARGDQGPIPIFGPERPPDELKNLNGFRRLPPQWAVEWKFLFELPGADVQPQPSLLIDAQPAGPLATPGGPGPAVAGRPQPAARLGDGPALRPGRRRRDGAPATLGRRPGARRPARAAVVLHPQGGRARRWQEAGTGRRAHRGRGLHRTADPRPVLLAAHPADMEAVPGPARRQLRHGRPDPVHRLRARGDRPRRPRSRTGELTRSGARWSGSGAIVGQTHASRGAAAAHFTDVRVSYLSNPPLPLGKARRPGA
jgi:hypothetical protein